MKLNKILFAMSSLALTGAFVSCSVDDYIANKDDIMKQLGDFYFQTSDEVMLDINYGPKASRALVQVYGQDPLAEASEDDQTLKGETVFTTFLDENGCFTGEVDFPAHIKELYAVSSSWGAPYLVKAEIKDNMVKLHAGDETTAHSTVHQSRATDTFNVRPLKPSETGDGNVSNLWTISDGWNVYGKSNDVNHLEDEGGLKNQDIADLQNFLWQGKTSKPAAADVLLGQKHSDFINALKTDKANIVVVDKYTDPVTGETCDVDNAEVWFTFVNEYAWNENSMGYYYYPEGTSPTKENLKMFIIVPNASVANHAPFGTQNSYAIHNNDDAPIKTNRRIQLLYVDDQGNASKQFPPGTNIGFFTIVNGFHNGSAYGTETKVVNGKNYYTTRSKGGISTAAKRFYSNKEFNEGGSTHYIAVRMADGTVVYGVEDASDNSFDDVLFTVTASPNLAIKPEASNVQEVPQEHVVEKINTDKSKQATYLFEDIWPNGGDYDLNDVVVRHRREITYNQFNYVSEVKEIFTVEPTPTTNDCDAIAFVIPEEHMSTELILPKDAVFEAETNSVFLTDAASKLYGKTVTVIRRGFQGVRKDDIFKELLNPYIVNQTGHPAWNENNRLEIHLTGYGDRAKVTSKALEVDNPLLASYFDASGMFPYALLIPDLEFKPCAPGVRIDETYPYYIDWVKSKGEAHKEWYKNK